MFNCFSPVRILFYLIWDLVRCIFVDIIYIVLWINFCPLESQLDGRYEYFIHLETSYSSGNTQTFTLIMLMSQIAFKETRTSA